MTSKGIFLCSALFSIITRSIALEFLQKCQKKQQEQNSFVLYIIQKSSLHDPKRELIFFCSKRGIRPIAQSTERVCFNSLKGCNFSQDLKLTFAKMARKTWCSTSRHTKKKSIYTHSKYTNKGSSGI